MESIRQQHQKQSPCFASAVPADATTLQVPTILCNEMSESTPGVGSVNTTSIRTMLLAPYDYNDVVGAAQTISLAPGATLSLAGATLDLRGATVLQ